MNSAGEARRELEATIGAPSIVRIDRQPRFAEPLHGFVVGVGKKWALLARVGDGGYFEGHAAFRVAEVKRIKTSRSFESTFASTQPEWPAVMPFSINLDKTADVVRAFADNAPLVGIEKEHERVALWIGTTSTIDRRWIWLREVRPNGRWRKKPLGYKLNAVTTISSGTRYMTALAAIAGTPPVIVLP